MKVTVVFDFPMITDPDSGEATDVIEYLTDLTSTSFTAPQIGHRLDDGTFDDDPRERTTLEIPAETTQQLADLTWRRLRGEEDVS